MPVAPPPHVMSEIKGLFQVYLSDTTEIQQLFTLLVYKSKIYLDFSNV